MTIKKQIDNQTENQKLYEDADYLTGRLPVPAWFYKKRSRSFVYASDKTSSTSRDRLDIPLDADSFFFLEGITCHTTQGADDATGASFQIFDSTYGETWSNAPVSFRDLFGGGATQKILSDPILFRPGTIISISSFFSTSPWYFAFIGRKVFDLTPDEAEFMTRRKWYQYITPVNSVPSGKLGFISTVAIYPDSDFLLKKIYSTNLIGVVNARSLALGTDVEILFQVRDTATGYQLFNKKLSLRLLAGSQYTPLSSAAQPKSYGEGFRLLRPVLFNRNSNIETEIDSKLDQATTNMDTICYEGIRIFDKEIKGKK